MYNEIYDFGFWGWGGFFVFWRVGGFGGGGEKGEIGWGGRLFERFIKIREMTLWMVLIGV